MVYTRSMRTRVFPTVKHRHLIGFGAVSLLALWLLGGCGAADAEIEAEDDVQGPSHQTFISRPDLQPVELQFNRGEAWSDEYANSDEYIFIAPDFESLDRKSTRLNSSHVAISYAVFCLKT